MKKIAEYLKSAETVDMKKVLNGMKKIKEMQVRHDVGPENFIVNDRSLPDNIIMFIEFPGGYLNTKPNNIAVEISDEDGVNIFQKTHKYTFTGTSEDQDFVKQLIKTYIPKAKQLQKKWGL